MAYSLEPWRLVRIHGRDPVALLNGQTTVDIKSLTSGQGVAGALCTPKGRMVANFGLAVFEDAAWISLPQDRVEALEAALAKYLPFFGCQYELTDWVGVGDTQPVEAPIQIDLGGLHEGWAPSGLPGEAGWSALRIQHALGWIDEHSHEDLTPQQLHLQSLGGISFTKGCYTGQEVIARTEHLGKVKKSLRPVTLNGAATPGDLFQGDRKVGQLLNVSGNQGLAILAADIEQCTTGDGINAQVQPLPYEITSPIKSRRNQ